MSSNDTSFSLGGLPDKPKDVFLLNLSQEEKDLFGGLEKIGKDQGRIYKKETTDGKTTFFQAKGFWNNVYHFIFSKRLDKSDITKLNDKVATYILKNENANSVYRVEALFNRVLRKIDPKVIDENIFSSAIINIRILQRAASKLNALDPSKQQQNEKLTPNEIYLLKQFAKLPLEIKSRIAFNEPNELAIKQAAEKVIIELKKAKQNLADIDSKLSSRVNSIETKLETIKEKLNRQIVYPDQVLTVDDFAFMKAVLDQKKEIKDIVPYFSESMPWPPNVKQLLEFCDSVDGIFAGLLRSLETIKEKIDKQKVLTDDFDFMKTMLDQKKEINKFVSSFSKSTPLPLIVKVAVDLYEAVDWESAIEKYEASQKATEDESSEQSGKTISEQLEKDTLQKKNELERDLDFLLKDYTPSKASEARQKKRLEAQKAREERRKAEKDLATISDELNPQMIASIEQIKEKITKKEELLKDDQEFIESILKKKQELEKTIGSSLSLGPTLDNPKEKVLIFKKMQDPEKTFHFNESRAPNVKQLLEFCELSQKALERKIGH